MPHYRVGTASLFGLENDAIRGMARAWAPTGNVGAESNYLPTRCADQTVAALASSGTSRETRKHMPDALTCFGLLSVGAMLLFYALEERSPWFVLAFALASWASALYAWFVGAWPFTAVELIWGVVALRRFRRRVS